MLLLESMIYHLHVHDKEVRSNAVGKLVNATNENINNPQIRHKVDVDKDQGRLLYFLSNMGITTMRSVYKSFIIKENSLHLQLLRHLVSGL